MKKFIFLGTLTLAACGVSKTEVKTDPIVISMPEIDVNDILKGLVTCQKESSTQDLSNVSASDLISITDTIAMQNFEVKDCNGKLIRQGTAPARELKQTIDLPKSNSLQGKLEFVEIKNDRTCKTLRVKVIKNGQYANYGLVQQADGTQYRIEQMTTRSNEDGEMQILISDSNSLIGTSHLLNVADGNNLISVKYYGECLESIEKPSANAGPEHNCKKGKEIGSQSFGINVQVDRSAKIEEIKSTRQCDK